jgi:hypothetical protein
MKKLLIIALVLVAVVFVAGCEEAADQGGAPAEAGAEPSGSAVTDISAAIASGSGYRCDSVVTQEGETYTFTWWVKGENMRGDWSYGGQTWHQIIKDNTTWMWDDTGNGFTMEIEEAEVEEPESYGMYTVEDLESDYEGQWSCTPTTVSSSKFDVPSDVQFMDLAQMMQQYQ